MSTSRHLTLIVAACAAAIALAGLWWERERHPARYLHRPEFQLYGRTAMSDAGNPGGLELPCHGRGG